MSEPTHLYSSQVEFSSDQTHEGSPETEFLQEADQSYDLKVSNDTMTFDDGSEHEMWTFETEQSGRIFPSPLLRISEGQIFHGIIRSSMGAHTLHWHGLEPDPRNDGVGHTSFEVTGQYTYQWEAESGRPGNPNLGAAGSYFYHCHVNTPLHVQMGMLGPLVIDPIVLPEYPVRAGVTRRSFVDGPEYDVETESLLMAYSLDPRWHELSHSAGLSGEDVGLDRFEPKHFFLMGGELATGPQGDGPWQMSALRANAPQSGRAPTLVRLLNGNYFPLNMKFTDNAGAPIAMAELIAHDGRPFRDTSDPVGDSPPSRDAGSPLTTSLINFGAAERYDVLLHPPSPGEYTLTVDLLHWITEAVLLTRVITITAE